MQTSEVSIERRKFLKLGRQRTLLVLSLQLGLLALGLALWEIAAQKRWIDPFIFSSPWRIWRTLENLMQADQLWGNIGVTVLETVLGFTLGTVLGLLVATFIWWSPMFSRVIEPYLVVLNALPKVALGPVIIVWMGASSGSIILMALMVSVVISILTISGGFLGVPREKVLLMQSFGANKTQIFTKLVLPANVPTLISTLKINVGMSLIGVITGEFLVSTRGVGYLIIYGGQVFKLDLVMAGIFILLVLAAVMYAVVAWLERKFS